VPVHRLAGCGAIVAVMLAGACGQKGPLYIPDEGNVVIRKKATPASPAPASPAPGTPQSPMPSEALDAPTPTEPVTPPDAPR